VTRGSCDTGIPADEALGVTFFPRGDVFCLLIADPKADGTFASYVRGTSTSALGTDLGSIGVGDVLGLFRWNGPAVGEGFQLSLSANVYAQFDLDTPSYDLINADYIVGLPATYRRGPFSARVRIYHQSSHLGDEFVLGGTIPRENFAFESLETILSAELGLLRAYGGGEYLFARRPEQLVARVVHGGVEARQALAASPLSLVAALDAKSADDLDWAVAWSGRVGLEIAPSPRGVHRSRRLSLLAEFYDGPSPYGQFFREDVRYYGVGLHLGP
jgi:hypothetical protein